MNPFKFVLAVPYILVSFAVLCIPFFFISVVIVSYFDGMGGQYDGLVFGGISVILAIFFWQWFSETTIGGYIVDKHNNILDYFNGE